MADCTYTYKSKTFSKDRLLRQLVDELPSRSQQASVDFLKEYLGMSENEIQIVKGLIDNKSLGRFKADGKILLSDLANPDVAYHEAFHRVWRMYLTTEERLEAIKELKKRKNVQFILDQYAQVYPKLSENELLEEYLADEFSDYTLNKDYKIETPIKSLFQRMWDFVKKLLGLKANQIQTIYDKILSKSFVGKSMSAQQYLKDADKLIIQGHEFTVEQKNEIIQVLTQKFIKAMLEVNGDIDLFLNNPTSKVKELVDEYVVAGMLSDILDNIDNSEDIVTAIYEDVDQWLQTNDSTKSIFINGLFQNLRLLGLEIKDDQVEDESEGSLDSQEKQAREFSSSIEFDPKSKMGKKIKLLLSSLTETDKTSNFGFEKPLSWTKAFVQIGTRMAGIPTSVFMSELQKTNLSYAPQLIDLLSKDTIFQNKFISTMAMTENKFLVMNHKDGDIYFFDANSGTKRDKVLREWQNNIIRKMEDWESWMSKTKSLQDKISKVTDQEILDHFGLVVDFSLENLKKDLHVIVNKASNYKGEKPNSKRIFEELGIRGYITNLAQKQSANEDQADLMVNLGSKKLYTLGLNTQQTTVLNALRYAQSLFTPEMTQSQKIELIKQFVPFQVSEFNVTKLSNGEYIIHNEWLKKILNGERIDLVIPYSIKTEEGEQSEISKLDEADLMSLHVNGALQGVNMSMKHADRSTFFAYKFDQPLYDKSQTSTVQNTLDILVNNIKEQIELEAKLVKNLRDRNLPIQHLGKNFENLAFASIIGKEEFQKVLDGALDFNTTEIYKLVRDQFSKFQNDVKELGLLETYETPIYKDGKKKGSTKRTKGLNNQLLSQYGSQELLLAAAFVNEVSNHIFETRFFSGDVRSFKNGTDLFKRLAPQSSTGNLSVNSPEAQKDVRQRLNQDFDIVNPLTGKSESVNPSTSIGEGKDKYFRAVTGAERENYVSHLLEPAVTPGGKPVLSKFTGKQESKLFLIFEDGYIKDFPAVPASKLAKLYESKIRLYEDKYSNINENDGQSYMTLPAFKNFMIRQGNWTDGMELVYQTEMKIANLRSDQDIADIEVEFKGVKFKPFEVNTTKIGEKKYDGWKKRIVDGKVISLDAIHTLKTQFAGYSTPEEYFNEAMGELKYTFNSVFKTSQHLLQPSSIIGTNLQLMNYSLLTNGVDIYHMGSANKVGGVDPRLAAKNIINNNDDIRNSRTYINDISERGLDFYDRNGAFNHEALTENLDILSYLNEWDYLKDQVNIGNKVKDEIKGSTQSLKILLSNLIVNGSERFPGAQQLVNNYKEVVKEMVKENHDNLLKRIGYDIDSSEFKSLDQLKKAVLGSSQMQNAPENVRNSVENFFEDPELGLEAVPLKNKIENVLYSLITNGIISFDRPGSSYPMAAVTGYEKLGSRKFNEDGIQRSNQDTLKFYNPIFDEEGNIIKVEPAEVIMPLPDYWIKPLLRWAKTNNLAKAIDMLNKDIEVRPELYQFKGLRIPNQQLSSNDILQVKKFNLPTMQNYILVPSEIVTKTGGDFDIDKLNVYWAKDTQNKIFNALTDDEVLANYEHYVEVANSEGEDVLSLEEFKTASTSTLDRVLLEQEKEILLHPRNAHHLLMPLTDEIFVKDIYEKMVKEGLIKEPSKSFFSAMLPTTNVKNTTIFVKGKFGVGVVALGITNKSTNQADRLNIAEVYNNQEGVPSPTKLLFKGLENKYSLDDYTDNEGTIVSEIQSQLLTTQVDNVKNPTAVLMNINMQTLNVVDYLVRRGVNPESIILLINQPLVKAYLTAQKLNESYLNKNADDELSKKVLIEKLLESKGYKETSVGGSFGLTQDVPNLVLVDSEMRNSIKEPKFDEQQFYILDYFLELQNQARAFSDFQQTQNSDTKGLKDKQMLDESEVIRGRVNLAQIINPIDVDRLDVDGVISPFYQYGRKEYSIFDRFYSLASSIFKDDLLKFKNKAAIVAKSADKDRVRQTIENDFILFLIHNFVTNKDEFNKLTKDQSVAKRVQDLKVKLPSNLVIKAFFPMLNNTTDLVDDKKIDSLRLFEKELNQLDSNDLRLSLEEIADTDIDLYNDIVKLLMFQTGLNISPFNYRSVVPIGLNKNRNEFNEYQYLYQDLLSQGIKEMKKQIRSPKQAEEMFKKFVTLFSANNPQFLRPNFRHSEYPYTLARTWNREKKGWVLKSEKGNQNQIQLGDAYHKQYFIEQINPNLGLSVKQEFVENRAQVKAKNEELGKQEIIASLANEETETNNFPKALDKYELFPGVFANKGQTEALDLLNKFLDSNEQEFTLIGRGGTGKTTIIKKILENQKGSVLGVTIAHKAKKVLGKSIGRDKVKTVASALAIKLDESTGNFVPDMYAREMGRVLIKYADIIIVDEASMISPNIYKEIMTLKKKDAKVIFMGDNAQLPPVGEQEDSPVFSSKNQYTLTEKMRQAKTSPIINVGSVVADNIESKEVKLIAIPNSERVNKFDDVSQSQVVFTSDEEQVLNDFVSDFFGSGGLNPDAVKMVTFNNEKHSAPQSVKNLNTKIREKLWGENAKNQFNEGELLTAYDSYSKDIGADEDAVPVHNSDDLIVTGYQTVKDLKGKVSVFSQKAGRREFSYEYDTVLLDLIDNDGKVPPGGAVPVIANSSKAKYEADLAKLWQTDKQLAYALKGQFANLQYGYAITSHKAQGSTYTNTYVFEDNILGKTNAGDAITKNKSLYVAVSRPTTKLVMISERNGDQVSQSVKEVPKVTSAIKTLPMQPDNIEQIKAGTKTITNRTGKFDDGTYKLPDGTMVEIIFVGTAKVTDKGIEIKDQVRDKDSYAKAEGFKDWQDFVENNKFSDKFIRGGESRYIYKVEPYQSIFELDKSQSNYSPSLKMYEGFINLNQLYTGEEILPFIGESEYYRYLVPMLLKMNPGVLNEFTNKPFNTITGRLWELKASKTVISEIYDKADSIRESNGLSIGDLNYNIIRDSTGIDTIVHELVHRTIQKEYEKKTDFYKKINDLFDHAVANSNNSTLYGYTSPTEFLAEALADPDFMQELNDIQYQDETVWSYLMTLVSDFINNLLNIELKSDSVLAQVVRLSEQVLQNNVTEMSKDNKIEQTEVQKEIVQNWDNYFPQYSWMNEAQKQMTAKLAEEGKITLTCKI